MNFGIRELMRQEKYRAIRLQDEGPHFYGPSPACIRTERWRV